MALTFDDELDFRQKFNLATALAEWDKPEEELAESGPEDDEASEELKVRYYFVNYYWCCCDCCVDNVV